MSYCRKGESSDIYLYGDISCNAVVCMWCCLKDKEHIVGEVNNEVYKGEIIAQNVILRTYTDAIKHVEEHRHAGDRVPYRRVLEHLKEDMELEGNIIDYSDIVANAHAESKHDNYISKPLRSQFRWV